MKGIKLNNIKAGFSLVEMLVVIAVIGILAAIAVPNIGKINSAASDSKDRRNAQQLASVCNAAAAAGLDFVGNSTSVSDVVDLVVDGGKVNDTTSPFHDNYFGVPNMSAKDKLQALDYLTIDAGLLQYSSGLDPVVTPNP